jgi:hypothetical protein
VGDGEVEVLGDLAAIEQGTHRFADLAGAAQWLTSTRDAGLEGGGGRSPLDDPWGISSAWIVVRPEPDEFRRLIAWQEQRHANPSKGRNNSVRDEDHRHTF